MKCKISLSVIFMISVYVVTAVLPASAEDLIVDTQALFTHLIRERSMDKYDSIWDTRDSNEDSIVDYAVRYQGNDNKIMEVLDTNFDGYADDFVFYRNGTLVYEEIDTNFDNKIDLWVFITDGKFVGHYQRDVDFDGIIDIDKAFGTN